MTAERRNIKKMDGRKAVNVHFELDSQAPIYRTSGVCKTACNGGIDTPLQSYSLAIWYS